MRDHHCIGVKAAHQLIGKLELTVDFLNRRRLHGSGRRRQRRRRSKLGREVAEVFAQRPDHARHDRNGQHDTGHDLMRLRHAQHEIEHKLVRPLEHHGPRAENPAADPLGHARADLLMLHLLGKCTRVRWFRTIVRILRLFRIHRRAPFGILHCWQARSTATRLRLLLPAYRATAVPAPPPAPPCP